jgi:hypothetical protein
MTACVATIYLNSTPATSTPLATINLNAANPSQVVAFSNSNVGAGTVLPSYNIGAGATMVIDLSPIALQGGGNVSVGIASVTANTQITIQWSEVQ